MTITRASAARCRFDKAGECLLRLTAPLRQDSQTVVGVDGTDDVTPRSRRVQERREELRRAIVVTSSQRYRCQEPERAVTTEPLWDGFTNRLALFPAGSGQIEVALIDGDVALVEPDVRQSPDVTRSEGDNLGFTEKLLDASERVSSPEQHAQSDQGPRPVRRRSTVVGRQGPFQPRHPLGRMTMTHPELGQLPRQMKS